MLRRADQTTRNRHCNRCGQAGGVKYDKSSQTMFCRFCGSSVCFKNVRGMGAGEISWMMFPLSTEKEVGVKWHSVICHIYDSNWYEYFDCPLCKERCTYVLKEADDNTLSLTCDGCGEVVWSGNPDITEFQMITFLEDGFNIGMEDDNEWRETND